MVVCKERVFRFFVFAILASFLFSVRAFAQENSSGIDALLENPLETSLPETQTEDKTLPIETETPVDALTQDEVPPQPNSEASPDDSSTQTDAPSETPATDGLHTDGPQSEGALSEDSLSDEVETQAPVEKDLPPEKEQKKFISYNRPHFFSGGITALASNSSHLFVSGKDGFVSAYSLFDYSPDTWQLSMHPILKLAVHPNLPVLAVYETDELSLHRISLWNWELKERIAVVMLENNVVSLSWSARGSYLFVGDTSIYGAHVYDISGNECPVFEVLPGIVLLAATAASERSVLTYSETGSLVYTSLKTNSLPTIYETEPKLKNPIILKNFAALAGYKNNSVFFIDAVSGKVTQKYRANSEPIFISNIKDTVPLWIEKLDSTRWSIKEGNYTILNFQFQTKTNISASVRVDDSVYIGTTSGYLYELQQINSGSPTLSTFSVPSFTPMKAIACQEKNIYVLTSDSIYAANEENLSFEPLAALPKNVSLDKITPCSSGLFLWNSEKKDNVYFYSFASKSFALFFKPKDVILDLSVSNELVLITQKHFGCTILKISDKKKVLDYKLENVQSAAIIENTHILIAKNAIDGESPIVLVDIRNLETLPFSIDGLFAYGLVRNANNPKELFCCVLYNDGGLKTDLYEITLNTDFPLESTFRRLLELSGESLNAKISSRDGQMVTNLGNFSLTAFNGGVSQVLGRSYSLFNDFSFSNNYLFALNADGTSSVYDNELNFVGILSFD